MGLAYIRRQTKTDRYILSTLPVFYASMRRDGAAFLSDDGSGHLCTVTGATWGSQGRTFVSGNYITAPVAQMNFTSGDFSILIWVKITSLAAQGELLCRGAYQEDGYRFYITTDGNFSFDTWQLGAAQGSYAFAGDIVINNWNFLGITRTGTSVKLYKNAIDRTQSVTSHTNPLTSTRTVKLGIYDDLSIDPMVGTIGEVLGYNRVLSPGEIQQIYLATKWRYQ